MVKCCSKARLQMKRAATVKAKKRANRLASKGVTPKSAKPKKTQGKKAKPKKAQPCRDCTKAR